MLKRTTACAFLLLFAACAGKAPSPKATARPLGPTDVARFLPLVDNTVFAFETTSEDTGERGVLMLKVRRAREDMAELGAGNRIQRLDLGPDGIRHATGGYLLKAPLSKGASWKGQFGDVRVTNANKAIEVPAGRFSGCVETVEESASPVSKSVTTVFCPEVGIVLLEAEGTVNGEHAHERAVLRSFGPAIDLNEAVPAAP